MSEPDFDLRDAAIREMIAEGFAPDFPPEVSLQLLALDSAPLPSPGPGIRDLRSLLWSSIDNDSSRDLDQAEVAHQLDEGIRLLIAIADVDSQVPIDSPIDRHAAAQTVSVYTGIRTFPMLPEKLSTDLTSVNQGEERFAVVVDLLIGDDGDIVSTSVYRALIQNQAQLTYNEIGPWLEGGSAVPRKLASFPDLMAQVLLQDRAAQLLRAARDRRGSLKVDRIEAEATFSNGQVHGLQARKNNRATTLIENFMVTANEGMARTLKAAEVSSIQRIVKTPERWPRLIELAARYGETLPPEPDSFALNRFLQNRKAADPVRYDDVALATVKLMGPGEYVLVRPGDKEHGHFALASLGYTHSTAPNRRYADTITQRLIKAVIAGRDCPYSDEQLDSIARNCTQKEDQARKVERVMHKRIAAVAMRPRIGETFSAVVTGVTPKGVFVRVMNPPAEGILIGGRDGVDVGDQISVRLVDTDPRRGYIDFVCEREGLSGRREKSQATQSAELESSAARE